MALTKCALARQLSLALHATTVLRNMTFTVVVLCTLYVLRRKTNSREAVIPSDLFFLRVRGTGHLEVNKFKV